METRHLEEFLDLMQTLNYQETADNMNTSQSSISIHIQQLENELGIYLFDRSGRNIQTNEYGLCFAEYAKQMLTTCRESKTKIHNIKADPKPNLKIGFSPFLGKYGIVELLNGFSKQHPDINLQILESSNSKYMLNSFSCDIFFTADYEFSDSQVAKIFFAKDKLVMICSSDHPFAKKSSISIEQLRNEPFIIHGHFDSSNKYHDLVESICLKHGFKPNIIASVSMTVSAAEMVGQGKGISLFYEKQLGDANRFVAAVPVYPEIATNICAFYLKERNLPATVPVFLKYMKSVRPSTEK